MPLLRLCDDPIVRELRSLHRANIVRVPSSQVGPLLSVAEKGGALAIRGEFRFLLTNPAALDLPEKTLPMPTLSSKRSAAVEAKAALKILGGILEGFGIGASPVEAALSGASELSIAFHDVRKRFVDPNQLGSQLAGAKVDKKNPAAAIYFGKGPHQLYVVDSVLESSSFAIKIEKSKSASAQVDLSKLTTALPAEVTVRHEGSDGSEIVFEGKRHLAFAFTCIGVKLRPNGTVEALPPGPKDQVLESGAPPKRLLSAPGMVSLEVPPRGQGDLEWFEKQNVESLVEALRDPKGTRQRIAHAIGEKGLQRLLKPSKFGPHKEGTGITDILFLHGIMGAHLDGDAGRPWFSFWAMITSGVAQRIRFPDNENLRPGDHLNMTYATARTAFLDRGFNVWPISYDWRKDIVACADGLHTGIEKLAQQPLPDGTPRRFAIVAHSMGGVIASLYASRHPEWSQRIEKSVFMGSPLKGSFAPFEAITGTYPFFKKLDMLALHSTLDDFRRTSTGLPGLLALLPDPDLDGQLLTSSNWPGGPAYQPSQGVLDAVKVVQPQISQSPLLQRTTLLAATRHPTVQSVVAGAGGLETGPRNGKGDGTVPLRSCACVGNAPTYEVFAEHSDIPGEWDAITAAVRILEGEKPSLTPLKPGDLTGLNVTPESAATDALMPIYAKQVKARFDAGNETLDDVRWLMSSYPLPTRQVK